MKKISYFAKAKTNLRLTIYSIYTGNDRNFRRNGSADAEEVFKRATKLAPNRKSGKERHSLYTQFDEEEEDAAFGYKAKQESVLDYYDDGEE